MGKADLQVTYCGVKLANPFLLASSPITDSREMVARGFEAGWAGAVLKTTTHPSGENSVAYPSMAALEPGNGLIGLHNTELLSDRFLDEMCEQVVWLKQRFPSHCVVLSIMGSTCDQWTELVEKGCAAGADMIEASISCPQGAMVEHEEEPVGTMVSQDARLTEKVTRWAKAKAGKTPVVVKLSPAVTDITSIARAVKAGGGDGICAIDSVEGIVGVDLENFAPLPVVAGVGTRGGFTGRAIKPVGLRCIADIAGTVDLPLSGVGGIYTWRDAVEYMLLGATSLQVCTAVMQRGFGILAGLLDGMQRWMEGRGFTSPVDFIGKGLEHLVVHEQVPHGIPVFSSINPELCIGCGLCHVACHDGGYQAIRFGGDRIAVVDRKACIGCGLCSQVCPVPDCIQMVNV